MRKNNIPRIGGRWIRAQGGSVLNKDGWTVIGIHYVNNLCFIRLRSNDKDSWVAEVSYRLFKSEFKRI